MDRLNEAIQALADGDWETLSGLIDDGFFSYQPGHDEPTASERFIAILSDLKRALPDLTASVSELTSEGDVFTGTLTISGTHENALWGAPGTGASFSWTSPVTIKPVEERFALRFDDVAFPQLIAMLRGLGLVNPPEEMDEPLPYPVSAPEFLLKVVMTGQAGDKPCSHLGEIEVTEPSTRVCKECFEEGTNWPALRMCLICGHVGCCDTSKNKHAFQHFEKTGHPLMRSIRMDEGWVWCYEDNAFFEKSILARDRQ
jgi:predicted ester cyclase